MAESRPSAGLWLVMGVLLLLVLLAGAYAASPLTDDWIFIGRSETLPEAISATLQRLRNWSPRPASESTIFGSLFAARVLGLPADDMILPLLIVSTLQATLLVLWPHGLRPMRAAGYLPLILALSCVLLTAALLHPQQVREVLFWGAGAAAYLPTLAAWLSALCCLYLWGLCGRRLFFMVALLQCLLAGLFLEAAITAALVIPGTALLVLTGLQGQLGEPSERRRIAPLAGSLLVVSAGLLIMALPALLRRYTFESHSSDLSHWEAIWWASQWPLNQGVVLFQRHGAELVVLSLLVATLLLSQTTQPPQADGAVRRLPRPVLASCGLAAIAQLGVIRYGLATTFGQQQFYLQRYEVISVFLLVLGTGFLLASVLSGWSEISNRIVVRRDWIQLLVLCTLVIALISSPETRHLLADSVEKGRGLKALPIRIAPDGRSGQYDVRCRRHAYAPNLPEGVWTRADLDVAIEAARRHGRPYELKILRGILSGYQLDRLTVFSTGPKLCDQP
jgi:hypothetical protein